MKIPKKVKIGGHEYKIIFCDEGIMKGMETDYGHMDAHAMTITLNSSLGKTTLESTFIHEAMHGMNSTLDHELLDSLAEQMYQFLSANKLLK